MFSASDDKKSQMPPTADDSTLFSSYTSNDDLGWALATTVMATVSTGKSGLVLGYASAIKAAE